MASAPRGGFIGPPCVKLWTNYDARRDGADSSAFSVLSASPHTDVPNCAVSRQAGSYEDDTRTEDDDADLHRQVDAEDFVFA
jgi:hypothetical protein